MLRTHSENPAIRLNTGTISYTLYTNKGKNARKKIFRQLFDSISTSKKMAKSQTIYIANLLKIGGYDSIFNKFVFDLYCIFVHISVNFQAWVDANPSKKVAVGINSVTHFYSEGDICEVTRIPRTVKVKLM